MNKRLVYQRLRAARVPAALGALGALPVHATLQTVAPGAVPAAAGGGLGQAFLGMAAVLALIFACAWAARRLGLQRLGAGSMVKVVSSTAVGRRERVVVIEVADTWVVLGVTASQVQALHTLPAHAGAPGSAAAVSTPVLDAVAEAQASVQAPAAFACPAVSVPAAPPAPPASSPMADPVILFARKLNESLLRNGQLSTQ